MLWLKALPLFIVGAISIIISLLVLLRGRGKLNSLSFSVLTISMAGWAIGIAMYLISSNEDAALFWAKIFYFFPLLIAVSLVIFVLTFPNYKKVSLPVLIFLFSGFAYLTSLLFFKDGFLFDHIVRHEWGNQIVLIDKDYLIYSIYLLICYPFSLLHIFLKSKKEKGLYAAQARFFAIGFLISFIFGITFNLILPWLGNYRLIWVGPISIIAFSIVIATSIIRHKMFDLRLVIARSVAYLLSLLSLATVYGVIIFGLMDYLLGLQFPFHVQLLLSATTGITALSFGYLKKKFDKLTNTLFYRDAYDSQEFFNELNKVLVTKDALDDLLIEAERVINKYLKSQYCVIVLNIKNNAKYRTSGEVHKKFEPEKLMKLQNNLVTKRIEIAVTDNLFDENNELASTLQQNDISVLINLTPNIHEPKEVIGSIVLGRKLSGNLYNSQDIKVLEAAADELIIAIQNALRFEEIQNFAGTLQEKVNVATRQLRQTNERLKLLDETKDDFISMASHQLRTPLTSMKGYISMVLDGDAGRISKQQRQMLEQAFISSQRMVYLIADLLNLSRLKTGKFIIDATPTNLAELVAQEVDQLQDTAKARGVKLMYDAPKEFPKLMLDETKTRQVIMNFLDNAIYYTPSGGKITISVSESAKQVEMRVTDTGIGVPKSLQPHLFTKFYRAPNAKRARPDGTGLGLFMARKAVVAQGGATIFNSVEGKGSTFGFTFPKAKLAVPEGQNKK